MKYPLLALAAIALAVTAVWAQSPASRPATPPARAPIATPPPAPLGQPSGTAPVSVPEPITATTVPVEVPATVPPPARATAPSVAPSLPRTASGAVPASTGVLLNFQGASLNDVLTYLSEAAGFVIVQEAPVAGTVNIVSRQPLTPEEAVDLLNTVLIEKGYTAIRNGRILKIINRRDAQKRDLPVGSGSDPSSIPRKDQVVTQILPLRFGEAAKLVENLRPLLVDTAVISANEGSNAIILTDTQTNIRRMATIIQALDTSVSALSTITVIPLKYGDSKSVADIITKLFAPAQQGQNQQPPGGPGRRPFPGFGFGGGGGSASAGSTSEARAAANRVVAVADEQSNSVVIAAPEEMVPTIRQMIVQIDITSDDIQDTKIFRLKNADAVELAATITSLYSNVGGTAGPTAPAAGSRGTTGGARGAATQARRPSTPAAPAGGGAQSERALLQSQVVAVGDPRTNSLLVMAAEDSMAHIDEIVERLDSTAAKRQHVYTHSLQHADPETVATVLRGMLGQQTGNASTAGTRLQDRSVQGASTDALNSATGGLGGSGRSSR